MAATITIWIICALAAYAIASSKDKSKAITAAALGIALGPIGVVYAMTLKDAKDETE